MWGWMPDDRSPAEIRRLIDGLIRQRDSFPKYQASLHDTRDQLKP
jgi:hypothetical protein